MVGRVGAFICFDDGGGTDERDDAEDLKAVVDLCADGFMARGRFCCWLED